MLVVWTIWTLFGRGFAYGFHRGLECNAKRRAPPSRQVQTVIAIRWSTVSRCDVFGQAAKCAAAWVVVFVGTFVVIFFLEGKQDSWNLDSMQRSR